MHKVVAARRYLTCRLLCLLVVHANWQLVLVACRIRSSSSRHVTITFCHYCYCYFNKFAVVVVITIVAHNSNEPSLLAVVLLYPLTQIHNDFSLSRTLVCSHCRLTLSCPLCLPLLPCAYFRISHPSSCLPLPFVNYRVTSNRQSHTHTVI